MMRILQINKSDRGGGAEGLSLELFRCCRKKGIDAWLAVGIKKSEESDIFEIPNDKYRSLWARLVYSSRRFLPVSRLRQSERAKQLLMPVAEPLRFFQYIKGYEDFDYPGIRPLFDRLPALPDIVHCHNLHGGYFDLRILPWLGEKFPLILNLHDTWLLAGHCAYFLDCNRWRHGCGHCPYLDIYPALWRDGTAYNWERKRRIFAQTRFYATAPSQWLIDQAQQSMLTAIEYRMIPNGIDLSIFTPGDKAAARRRLGLPEAAKIVLFAANKMRSNPYKDFQTVEQAIQEIADQNRLPGLLFVCVGSTGKDQIIGQVRVSYQGHVASPEVMADYYRSADLFVHTAKAEAFGKTIIEAQACGTPVVATAVGGIPELINHGQSGYLIPISNPRALASCIEQVLKDESLRLRMAELGHKSAQRYSIQRQAEAFLDWYTEIIAKHNSSTL